LLSGFALKSAPPSSVTTAAEGSPQSPAATAPSGDDDTEIQIVDDEPKGRSEGGSSHA